MVGRKPDPNRSRRAEQLAKSRKKSADQKNVHIPKCKDKRRRQRLEQDDLKWLAYYFGEGCGLPREACYWYPFVSQQVEMIQAIGNAIRHGGDEGLFASRGEGKTTNAQRTLLKHVLTGTISFAVLLSATAEDAKGALDEINNVLCENVRLREDYPEVCVPVLGLDNIAQRANGMTASGWRHDDQRKRFDVVPINFQWAGNQLRFPNVPGSPSANAVYVARGLDASIRGLKKLGLRPKIVVIDDPDTPDTVNNPTVARRVEDNIDMGIAGLGSQQRQVSRVMLCTLPHTGVGVAHTYADREKKPSFVSKRFSFMVSKPDRMDLWQRYIDLRRKCQIEGDKYAAKATKFYADNRELMDAGAVVANPNRYSRELSPDGQPVQLSAVQHYFDHWADKGRNGEMYCRCELDNEIIKSSDRLVVNVSPYRVLDCVGTLERNSVDSSTVLLARGIDIRKTEVHFVELAEEKNASHVVCNYDIVTHGNSETTVEQSERMILESLRRLKDEWRNNLPTDENGMKHSFDVTLIDKGWVGNWNEDGEIKTWASQPVETFCMEQGLRHFLPAKGQAPYRSPAPGNDVIIGDRWHMNRGEGKERACTEVIWDSDHWHILVEELFLLSADDPDRFSMFVPRGGIWTNHKAFGEHITIGVEVYKESKNSGSRSRKPRFVRDHWFDAAAMALVAQSVEHWFRANLKPASSRRRPAGRQHQRSISSGDEIGAR